MSNTFSGLESMGLKGISDMDLFADDAEKKEKPVEKKVEKPIVDEHSFLFDKTWTCPVCDVEFKSKTVKTGKAKLISQDVDLRPRYSDIDSLKYGVVACPNCGYAALGKNFPMLTHPQAKLIKEKISASFTGLGAEGNLLSYDDAIARHKLALVNAVVKRGKISERAYICLLLAWLLRGKRETLPEDTPDIKSVKKSLIEDERDFLSKAHKGFDEAFSSENFPLAGLDEHTATYLVGALATKLGAYDEAMRWLSRLITSRSASERIKDKARRLKDYITEENAKNQG